MTRCVCGTEFSAARYLNKHKKTCQTVLKQAERTYKRAQADKEERASKRLRGLEDENLTEAMPWTVPSAWTSATKQVHATAHRSDSVSGGCHGTSPPIPRSGILRLNSDDQNMVLDEPPPLPDPLPQAPEDPPGTRFSRRGRKITGTWKVRDQLPEADCVMPQVPDEPEDCTNTQPARPARRVVLLVTESIRSAFNRFGLRRFYKRRPHHIPNATVDLDARYAPVANAVAARKSARSLADVLFPFPNLSAFLFANHHAASSTKSLADRASLQVLLTRPDFKVDDIADVNFKKIDERLAEGTHSPDEPLLEAKDGWRQSSITIGIPSGQKPTQASRREEASTQRRLDRHQHVPDTPAPQPIPGIHYTVHGFWHKNLCAEIKQTLSSDPAAKDFVFDPHYVEHQELGGNGTERVHGELYNSEAFVQEDIRLQNSPREPGCDLPRAIAALMFWSDATQIAQFGQAKVWPSYLYYGNQSKYDRARPTAQAAHHVAYFPSLPDNIQDFIRHQTGKAASAPLLAHCRRELFHGAWALMLDAEFVHAWKHDYPEKVLIATVRDKGRCPCPRCLVTFDQVPNLGEDDDTTLRSASQRAPSAVQQQSIQDARELIYRDGYVVNSERVEALLQPTSLVPTTNAFGKLDGLDYYQMLVVDLLHEYELGVWKSLFAHLVRILDSVDSHAVDELNARFRQVPTFGRSTIRRFAHNVAEMKRMAARDFEDILQCIIPCIENLVVTEHNETILTLLYHVAYWHALAKMRMHTDRSLALLTDATTILGRALRFFAHVTCAAFDTKESRSEYDTRKRAEARRQKTIATSLTTLSGRRPRGLNLKVVKLHFLGDYVRTIKRFGTSDSYTTQIGEHEHRRIKARRKRTNYVQPDSQVVNMDIRAVQMQRIGYELDERGIHVPGVVASQSSATTTCNDIAPIPATDHHHIARDQKNVIALREWQREHTGDVAVKDFLPHLRQHLLLRIRADNPEVSISDADHIIIIQDRIYKHATLQINYTTYDLQREQDIVHAGTDKTGIMVYSPATTPSADGDGVESELVRVDTAPWIYADTIGIYHCNIQLHRSEGKFSRRIDFVWVRWLELDGDHALYGTNTSRLERVSYVPFTHGHWDDTFGFVDPAAIIRGCHFIPAFAYKRSTTLVPPCMARPSDGDCQRYLYVNRFVDRDMFVRHIGHGIGHLGLQCSSPDSMDPSTYCFDVPLPQEVEGSEESDVSNGMEGEADEEIVELDEIEDEEDLMATDTDAPTAMPDAAAIQQKGAMLGIVGDLFRDFAQIINVGIAANPNTPLSALKFSEKRDIQLYRSMIACLPTLPDNIAEQGPSQVTFFAALLDKGRNGVRSSDLNSAKTAIAGWRSFVPPIPLEGGKDLRGFNHPQCGKLLCPAKWDWSDPEVATGLRNGSSKYPLSPLNLPNFLWEDERVRDENNLLDGFARGPLLVTALRHSLLGPKAATAPSSTKIAARKPKAQNHQIRSITPGCIAYAAILVHFSLSTQETFSASGYGSKFNYEMFYQAIIQTIEEYFLEAERRALLAWWNGNIFNAQYNIEAELDNEADGDNGELSVFAQMREQARARQEQQAASEEHERPGEQAEPSGSQAS
ncbi:hypothetical protein ONZ51_g2145 [Trametes cubensis]|uniref:Uncharacterized protein n=1 Tax=Trametes cubensis TaxID=1111947 RepID=A0AAD7U0S0_9APHY|nr:hypothetical protein ONZ51_g2145 [Trametes cubensis]